MLSKRYESTEDDRRTWLHVPSGTLTKQLKYILLKRSLESVARISLYYQLQTPADFEWIYRSSLNFQKIFPTSLSLISVKSNKFPMMKV